MFQLFDREKSGSLSKPEGGVFVIVGFESGTVPDFKSIDHFELYCIRDGKIVTKRMLRFPDANDESGKIRMMKQLDADAVIAAKFLPRDLAKLREAGIKACSFDGGPGAAIREYRKGNLKSLY
ncbi:MAG: NifB/NifX family molybdenum-iron cluster-binding protein [Lachnospiraceae bacterium]|jgi:predicted Fe-Mo cluster-binding NifX family protein